MDEKIQEIEKEISNVTVVQDAIIKFLQSLENEPSRIYFNTPSFAVMFYIQLHSIPLILLHL